MDRSDLSPLAWCICVFRDASGVTIRLTTRRALAVVAQSESVGMTVWQPSGCCLRSVGWVPVEADGSVRGAGGVDTL